MKDYKGKQKTAKDILKGCSYAKGGKVGKTKAHISPSEEKQVEKAKKEVGKVSGKQVKTRLDKLARGGKAKHKAKTQVNVMVQPGQQKIPVPVPVSPKVAMPSGAPGIPTEPPPPGAGLPQGLPPAGMGNKKGGAIKKHEKRHKRAAGGKIPHMDAGAGGGLGRLEKAKLAAKQPKNENE